MQITRGSRIRLEDEGEGWFPPYIESALSGTVITVFLDDSKRDWCVVAFDEALELQRGGAPTPSGFGQFRYRWAVICPRGLGRKLSSEGESCFVSLVFRLLRPIRNARDFRYRARSNRGSNL
jgi:hypothetical protein